MLAAAIMKFSPEQVWKQAECGWLAGGLPLRSFREINSRPKKSVAHTIMSPLTERDNGHRSEA